MKKIYLTVLSTVILATLNAQTFQWAKREGLWAYDYSYGISTDNAGNVIVAGKYEEDNANFSGTMLPCAGNHDMFLISYSPTGSVNWARSAGGVLGDYAHNMVCDGANYIYVAGEIEGAGDVISFSGSPITLTAVGDNDIMTAKYDLSGNLIWAKSEGGFNGEKALSVDYDASGNVYVGGYFSGATVIGGNSIPFAGEHDAFLIKYDAAGNFQWVKTIAGPGREEILSTKCDAAGNVYVCGMYKDGAVIGSTTLSSPLTYLNNFLAKFAPDGSLLWVKTSGSDYDDVAWSLAIDNAGKVYMGGEFNAYATFDAFALTTNGDSDCYVACYDASGNVQWVTQAGGGLYDRIRGIGSDGTKIFVTGQFGNTMSVGSTNLTSADSSDIFIAALNNSGSWIWGMSVGGPADSVETLGYESGVCVHADASGYVYAGGALLDGGTFGSQTFTELGRTDAFVAKIAQTGAGIEENPENGVALYPNPTSGVFMIDLTGYNGKNIVKIINTLGQIVYSADNVNGVTTIDLTGNERGVYFVEVTKGADVSRQKVVIQ